MDVFKYRGLTAKDIKGKVTVTSAEITNYNVRKDDVFFTRTSETVEEIGTTSVITEDLHKTVFSGFILRARPKNNWLDTFYKKYCFSSASVRKEITSTSSYTTRALINGKLLSEVKFPLPPLPEQQAIAEVLSDVDALVTSLDQLITKKRNIKQGAMQLLLTGKKRLAGFSGEWETKKVKSLGEVVTGSTPSTSVKEYWNGLIPWITPTDITDKKNISKSERHITGLGLSKIRKLPANSVLVTCIASIGKNAILRKEGASNQQINAIIPSRENDTDYIYYLVELKKNFLLGSAGIAATSIISKKDFEELEFTLPNAEEQKALAQILSDMDAEIEALEQKRDKYKAVKRGMMQELLTGKLRLKINF